MFNTAKRAIAIVLALALVFALAGCSKPVDDGSSIVYEYVTDTVYVDGGSGTTSGGSTSGGSTSGGSTGGGSTTKTESIDYSDSPVKANPEDYRGTKIIFASTIDPKDDGTDYVVTKFEEEYGIEVEITVPTLENYNAEMAALITAGKAPTVGRSNGDAPIYVGYFDSLDKAQLNYDHPLWNQNTFKLSTYNGSPRLCDTMGNFWTEIDMVAYSKSLLDKADCPTPAELDAQGKWTIDAYINIGKLTAELDGCNGAALASYDTFLNMSGGSVYRVDSNNMMVNGIDATTTNIMTKVADAFTKKYLVRTAVTGLITGEVSIATTHLWSLRTDGNLKNHTNKKDIGYYYLPTYEEGGERYVTGLFRGWGIMKKCNDNPATGSKAAVAGGLFLSEYLDVSNYNLESSFINEEAKKFFFQLCEEYANTKNYNPYYTTYDLNEGISGLDDDSEVYTAMVQGNAEQVNTKLKAAKDKVDNACKNLNDYITANIYGNN